jgi:hypothetical protein
MTKNQREVKVRRYPRKKIRDEEKNLERMQESATGITMIQENSRKSPAV